MGMRVRLTAKMIGAFLCVAVIASAAGGYGILALKRSARTGTELYRKTAVPLDILFSAKAAFEELSASIGYAVLDQRLEHLANAEKLVETIEKQIANYESTLIDAEDQRLHGELVQRWQAYKQYYEALKKFIQDGEFEKAVAYRSEQGDTVRTACRNSLHALVDKNVRFAESEVKANEEQTLATTRIVSIATVICLLLAIGIGVAIERHVNGPGVMAIKILEALADGNAAKTPVVQAIAAGDLSREFVPTTLPKIGRGLSRSDEIGDLFRSLARLGDAQVAFESAFVEMTNALRAAQAEGERGKYYVRSLIEANLDPLVTISPEGKITDVNQATEEATGAGRAELVGRDFADFFSDPVKARAGYAQVFREGKVHDYPLELRHRDGSLTPVLYNASVYRDADGGVAGVFAAARDVTALRRVEGEIRRSGTYARNLIEANLDPLVTISPEGKITDVNQATEEATGVQRAELIGQDFADFFSDPGKARAGYAQVFHEGTVRDYPLELRHRGGRLIPVLYNASVYRDADGSVAGVFAAARDVTELRKVERERADHDWIKTGLARLSDILRSELTPTELAAEVIKELTKYVGGQVGVFYAMDGNREDPALKLIGSYAYTRRKHLANSFSFGEGLVGQAALERQQILISEVPEDYLRIASGLGETAPRQICVTPLLSQQQVKGVIEVATLGALTDLQLEYLAQAVPQVAVTLETVEARERVRHALRESQRLAEELKAQQAELQMTNRQLEEQAVRLNESQDRLRIQQEELQASNAELEEQTLRLKESEENLRTQQEELQVTNEELEEKNELLERQTREVEQARKDLEAKATELAAASKYKSEFLANMSHELRTPLNSLLLLARRFVDNQEGNLTQDQVESARVIHSSGNDLLSLINEILDLSKIEAGRMELHRSNVQVSDLAESTRDAFQHVAELRGLVYTVEVHPEAPLSVHTDRKRTDQIIRNLVSNALKFTERGSVKVTFRRAEPAADHRRSGSMGGQGLAIAVEDTGIGIPSDKHKLIFDAFQQADGSTSRKYGGTGLGLSISRELARLLGGRIHLTSQPGQGSTFTLYLPCEPAGALAGDKKEASETAPAPLLPSTGPVAPSAVTGQPPKPVPDDRDQLVPNDRVMLVIEDDVRFAGLLVRQCRERGFKCLVAVCGEDGLDLARRFLPVGVILDLRLPGLSGWDVLDALKADPTTRHIPVHIMSADDPTNEGLRKGAIGQLKKPVTREDIDGVLKKLADVAMQWPKHVLVVDHQPEARQSIIQLIADEGQVQVDEAANAAEALDKLQGQRYDCVIVDLGQMDADGDHLLKQIHADNRADSPPVVVYTSRDLTVEEELDLRSCADSIIIKDSRSDERLLDEVSLFLHCVVVEMPERKRRIITSLHDVDARFRDKKVLVADDDMRAVFALSRLLNDRGMTTLKAENGEKALKLLDENEDVDLVLIDVMMPVMDGLETMRRIRAQERFRKLPIIALTAKAMKGDQDQCVVAGASDYLPKPIDQDRLLSLMRVWLH
jgi:PAS domain S-box-containing protein